MFRQLLRVVRLTNYEGADLAYYNYPNDLVWVNTVEFA